MIKKKYAPLIGVGSGLVVIAGFYFVYWMGGGDWVRGESLGMTAGVSMFFGLCFGAALWAVVVIEGE